MENLIKNVLALWLIMAILLVLFGCSQTPQVVSTCVLVCNTEVVSNNSGPVTVPAFPTSETVK